jgi:hypothetical protein
MTISPRRRQEIIDALRRGTVPHSSLDALAVGLGHFEAALGQELLAVKGGGAVFKAVRGDYGCGKTFFARWQADRARKLGFATSEVQVSETETPLHRLETVYRRLCERLATADTPQGALRNILDGWFYALEQDALAETWGQVSNLPGPIGQVGNLPPQGERELLARTSQLMEQRLAKVTKTAPMFGAALRGYRQAQAGGDPASADALMAWLAGQPNVAAAAKRSAGVKGEIDHFGALTFLQGLLTVLRDSGGAGLLIVLDEVETLQRVRGDVRDKGLNALRQLIDEVDGGRFPGLYLLITGTPAFFDGPQGVQRLEPLAQRLHVDFATEARFDNPRAVQVRLAPFDLDRLGEVGCRVRAIYQEHSPSAARIAAKCDDGYVRDLASAVAGRLGGRVGIAPRVFLKKLVADVLDRIDQFPDFEPRQHYALTVSESELTAVERNAAAAQDVDDIELEP